MFRGALQTAYLAIGVVVAYKHAYLGITDWQSGVSALAAVVLWPLELMGVNMHLAAL